MSKNHVSTRHLGKEVGKSTNYISSLLLGKIKTIEYDTAYQLVKVLTPGIDAEKLLIEDFGIEPDAVIEKRMKEAEKEQEYLLERIKHAEKQIEQLKGDLIADITNNQAFEKLEVIKDIIAEPIGSDYFKLLEIIKYLRQNDLSRYRILLIFANELYISTGRAIGDLVGIKQNEEPIRGRIENFIKEVSMNGIGPKEGKEICSSQKDK